jgi:hypothetical protein
VAVCAVTLSDVSVQTPACPICNQQKRTADSDGRFTVFRYPALPRLKKTRCHVRAPVWLQRLPLRVALQAARTFI